MKATEFIRRKIREFKHNKRMRALTKKHQEYKEEFTRKFLWGSKKKKIGMLDTIGVFNTAVEMVCSGPDKGVESLGIRSISVSEEYTKTTHELSDYTIVYDVCLERPGLIIGKGGCLIDEIERLVRDAVGADVDIRVKECSRLRMLDTFPS